jgi:aspartate racemase
MSWESSAVYYKLLNQGVEERLGGLSSAEVVLSSVDFGELTGLQREERWDEVGAVLAKAAAGVQAAGADLLLLCTTSFHIVADQVEAAIDIPLLHLADVVADAIKAEEYTKVGFLGTAFAMGRPFFTDRLASHGLTVTTPAPEHHEAVDRIIYDELVHGRTTDRSRRAVADQINTLWDEGAEAAILGCTELETLVKQADVDVPLFPVTTLHVKAALDSALA